MITVLENPVAFSGGIKLSANKTISLAKPLTKAILPELIKLPLRQHIGSSATPIVKAGDTVFKGQLIAEAQINNGMRVHASTSGIVKGITESVLPEAPDTISECIVIQPDGEDRWYEDKETIVEYNKLAPAEVIKKIKLAGITGCSGFSTINPDSDKARKQSLIIINAAETEPYISCDEAIIRTYIEDVMTGIEILSHALQVDSCVITVEEDKSELIKMIKDALSERLRINIDLKLISSLYPADEEKQLIKSITGIELSFETSSLDAGVVVENISTVYAIKKAIIDGEPLTSRVVTITGPGINQPCNLDVLLGTPISEIIEQCGGYTEQFEFLVCGGPMTGLKLDDDMAPLTISINCLLAFSDMPILDNREKKDMTVCHDCEEVCPVNIKPHVLHEHIIEKDENALIDSGLFECIECGCCNYVCSNHIQLVQEFRQAKIGIREQQRKRLKAEKNKKRYLNKLARKAKQEEEKAKRREKKTVNNQDDELSKKKEMIAAAVSRVRKKRLEKDNLK